MADVRGKLYPTESQMEAAYFFQTREHRNPSGSGTLVSKELLARVYRVIRKDTIVPVWKGAPGEHKVRPRYYLPEDIAPHFAMSQRSWQYAVRALVRAGLLEEEWRWEYIFGRGRKVRVRRLNAVISIVKGKTWRPKTK